MVAYTLITVGLLLSFLSQCSGLQNAGGFISRQGFLFQTASSVVCPSLFFGNTHQPSSIRGPTALMLPLSFLPNGGCLALKISVIDRSSFRRLITYAAIVDTGSPFATVPPEILPFSVDKARQYPPTQEQYGEAVGTMQWLSVRNLEVITSSYEPFDIPKMIVGLPDATVVDDTGGIFLGLITQDDYRPAVLRQWGYSTFVLDYHDRLLTLHKESIIANDDPDAMQLFDFSPYGDNLHHYGIRCISFSVLLPSNNVDYVTIASLKRPVVAVIDTGLTGCVFSDSLKDELAAMGYDDLEQLKGAKVTLPTVSGGSMTLSSNPRYWFLSSFKLPWFVDDDKHPHVIAMGATFLTLSRLSVDPISQRIKLEI